MLENRYLKPYSALLMYDFAVAFSTSFFLYIFIDNNINSATLSNLYLFNLIFIFILEIPTGYIADSIGRKKTMILSNTCFIASYIVLIFLPKYIILHFVFTTFALCFRSGSLSSWLQEFAHNSGNQAAEFQKFAIYRFIGRLLGSSFGCIAFIILKDYFYLIILVIIGYTISIFLFYKLPEEHTTHKHTAKSHINSTLVYIKYFPIQFILLTLVVGAIFVLSLPIFMYYPAHINLLFGDQVRINSVITVQISFVIMCIVGYLLSIYAKRILTKNSSKLGYLSLLFGGILGAISVVMYYFYKMEYYVLLVILPIICSGLFGVIQTLAESTNTNIIKQAGYEGSMSTIMSIQSGFGMLVFSAYYFIVNSIITGPEYSRMVLIYILILPISFIVALSLYLVNKKYVKN